MLRVIVLLECTIDTRMTSAAPLLTSVPWGPDLTSAPTHAPPPCATRDDESHMACRPIRRKPPGQVLADCAPEGESGNASTVAEGLASQTWAMDPAYYQYRNCRCLDVRRAGGGGGAGPRRCTTQQPAR